MSRFEFSWNAAVRKSALRYERNGYEHVGFLQTDISFASFITRSSRQGGINGLIKLTGRGATIVCFHCEEKQRYYSCKRLRDCPFIRYLISNGASEASVSTMQFRTVLDVKVVDVEKRRNPSKHYVSWLPIHLASFSNLMLRYRKTHLDNDKEHL